MPIGLSMFIYVIDAVCVSLPDDKNKGLVVSRPDQESVLVPFRQNVSLTCQNTGRYLRKTATSNFRQCVYDPKPVSLINEVNKPWMYIYWQIKICFIRDYQITGYLD